VVQVEVLAHLAAMALMAEQPHLEEVLPHLEEVLPHLEVVLQEVLEEVLEEVLPHLEEVLPHLEVLQDQELTLDRLALCLYLDRLYLVQVLGQALFLYPELLEVSQ
jgi:hypothetical protein